MGVTTGVATASANIDWLRFAEQASPSTPASGFALAYFKVDGLLYTMDDAGLETGPITNAAAVILNPASDVRNIIEPAADFIPLIVRGSAAAQTKQIFVAQEGSADTAVFTIAGAGAAQFQNFTDSSSAFKVTNKAGAANVLEVRTDGFNDVVATYASWAGSGNKTNVRALALQADNDSADVVTNAEGLHIYQSFNNGAGSITNARGLYIEDVDAGGTTNHSVITNAGFVVFNEGGAAEADIRIETTNEDHFIYVDTGADWLRIGDWDTNYTHFAVDGIQTMVGTGRVKKTLNLPVGGTGGGASKPTFDDTFAPFDGWLMSIGDDLHYEFEIPYDCDTTEDIVFDFHWYIDRAYADENAEVNWQIAYRAVTEDGTEPVDSGGSSATVTSGDINIPATNKSYLETGITIVAANIDLDDTVGIDFTRIALVGGADPGGAKEPIVSQVHITYTCNKLGEAL